MFAVPDSKTVFPHWKIDGQIVKTELLHLETSVEGIW